MHRQDFYFTLRTSRRRPGGTRESLTGDKRSREGNDWWSSRGKEVRLVKDGQWVTGRAGRYLTRDQVHVPLDGRNSRRPVVQMEEPFIFAQDVTKQFKVFLGSFVYNGTKCLPVCLRFSSVDWVRSNVRPRPSSRAQVGWRVTRVDEERTPVSCSTPPREVPRVRRTQVPYEHSGCRPRLSLVPRPRPHSSPTPVRG